MFTLIGLIEIVNLKGFATFWEFSFYGQKKVADYEYHSLFAEKKSFSYLIFQF